MKKVRVIQIGTGHDHAACTIRSLKSLPDRYEIIGVAEPNENFKDRLNTKDYIDLPQYDAEEILKLEGIDAVCIETDELSSTYWAKRAIDLGLPVHLDKPGAPDFDSFEELVNTAKQNNVPIVENRPVARALYNSVPVDGIIPSDLYVAVAEILAYVYNSRKGE